MEKPTVTKTSRPSPEWLGEIEDTLHAVEIDFTAAFGLAEAASDALCREHHAKAQGLLGAAVAHLDSIAPKMAKLYEAHQEGRDALVKPRPDGKQPCQSDYTFAEARQKQKVHDCNELEDAIADIGAYAELLIGLRDQPGLTHRNPAYEEWSDAMMALSLTAGHLREAASRAHRAFHGKKPGGQEI